MFMLPRFDLSIALDDFADVIIEYSNGKLYMISRLVPLLKMERLKMHISVTMSANCQEVSLRAKCSEFGIDKRISNDILLIMT